MGDVGAFDALIGNLSKKGVKPAVDSCCSETRTFVTLFDKIDWIFRISKLSGHCCWPCPHSAISTLLGNGGRCYLLTLFGRGFHG